MACPGVPSSEVAKLGPHRPISSLFLLQGQAHSIWLNKFSLNQGIHWGLFPTGSLYGPERAGLLSSLVICLGVSSPSFHCNLTNLSAHLEHLDPQRTERGLINTVVSGHRGRAGSKKS